MKFPLLISIFQILVKHKMKIKIAARATSKIHANIIGIGIHGLEQEILSIVWPTPAAMDFFDESMTALTALNSGLPTVAAPKTRELLKKIASSPNRSYNKFIIRFRAKLLGKNINLYETSFDNKNASSFLKEAKSALNIIS